MTEIDGRSLIAPHPDHPGAECPTCGAPATEWAYPLCTACLIQYRELAAEGEIEQGMAIIRKRNERIAELEAALATAERYNDTLWNALDDLVIESSCKCHGNYRCARCRAKDALFQKEPPDEDDN